MCNDLTKIASYTSDPASIPLDRLRFELGDTDVDNPLLVDAEYQFIIDTYPNNTSRQLAAAFRAGATAIAIKATKRTLGPQSEDNSARLNYYATMADKYEHTALFTTTPPLPNYDAEKIFTKGMMANES